MKRMKQNILEILILAGIPVYFYILEFRKKMIKPSLAPIVITETINDCSLEKYPFFDIERIKKGDNLFIIGETGKGKTALVKKLMENRVKENGATVELIVSPTEILERQYIPSVKSGIIYRKYHKDFISKFITKQVENIGDFVVDDTKESVVILDNCLRHSEDSELIDLVSNGVFYQTVNIITTSSPFSMSDQFDSCMDYIFVFNTTQYIYIKCLYNKYFKEVIPFEEFKIIMKDIKGDHTCIVIDCKDMGKIYKFNISQKVIQKIQK